MHFEESLSLTKNNQPEGNIIKMIENISVICEEEKENF